MSGVRQPIGEIKPPAGTEGFEMRVLSSDVGRGDYIEVEHNGRSYLLIVRSIKRARDEVVAECLIVGSAPRTPFTPGAPVYRASEEIIGRELKIETSPEKGIYIGLLRGHGIPVCLPIKNFGRVFIVGKTGSGKSYTMGVVAEELMKKKIPLVIIDTHGEYSSLKVKGDVLDETFKVVPRSYADQVVEFADLRYNPGGEISLDLLDEAEPEDLVEIGRCTIVNLRGVPQKRQEEVVRDLAEKLLHARMIGRIPPFYLVVDEAHLFAGKMATECLDIIRRYSQEGRKFAANLIVMTQRPQALDVTVRSGSGTWIIHRLTDPNDIKAIIEGIGLPKGVEREIPHLDNGEAIIVGEAVEYPTPVKVRPRETRHGAPGFNPLEYVSRQLAEERRIDDIKEELKRRLAERKGKTSLAPEVAPNLLQLYAPIHATEEDIQAKLLATYGYAQLSFKNTSLTYYPAILCEAFINVNRSKPPVTFSETVRRLLPCTSRHSKVSWKSCEVYGVSCDEIYSQNLLDAPEREASYVEISNQLTSPQEVEKLKSHFLAHASAVATKKVFYHPDLKVFSLVSEEDLARLVDEAAKKLEEELIAGIEEKYKAKEEELLKKLSEIKQGIKSCEKFISSYLKEIAVLMEKREELARSGKSTIKVSQQISSRQHRVERLERKLVDLKDRLERLEEEVERLKQRKEREIEEGREKIKGLLEKRPRQLLMQPKKSEVELNAFQLVWIPVFKADVLADNGEKTCTVRIEWNAINGKGVYGRCCICGEEILDVHENWLCSICLKPLCEEHVIKCSICESPVCREDSWQCKTCGEVFCKREVEHWKKCATCGEDLCSRCVQHCVLCGEEVSYCSEHVRKCEVCEFLYCERHYEEHIAICSRCGGQTCTAASAVCSICSKVFCENCIVKCSECGKEVCLDHAWTCSKCGRVFCRNERSFSCKVCGETLCKQCAKLCDGCSSYVCEEHLTTCPHCGRRVCTNCLVTYKWLGLFKRTGCRRCVPTHQRAV